ncbi:MAG: BrnA antitoxin family protein [Rhodobiaceae bacterium]|nr:BrnA antitoxin family protein [Rhodobiaceae bacterium]MCC0048524.1 BrnA antitoxin family protein [Rhodobiaceae bacterium]
MNGKPKTKLEPLPELKSDEAAERFVDDADLTQFDLSGGQRVHFEFERKDKQINLRMPERLVDAVKARAAQRGIPYQRFIREAIEKALG